jgi:outer membrane protein assembly factor BamB
MRYTVATFSIYFLAATLRAEDVPQFRGLGGTGVSGETGLPIKWGEKENLLWKAELPGRGLSNPVIAGGRIFLTACSGPEQKREHVLCFDARTGKQLWERQLSATGTTLCHPMTCMAAPTPVTDGEHVYALFATGDLVCYAKDGELAWYRSLVGDYPTIGNNVGLAVSPVLHNGMLIVCLENVGESFVAGIDARTGQNRWRLDRPRGINWVTPLLIKNAGRAEVLVQGPGDLTAHDPLTGKKHWSLTGQSLSSTATPVWADGKIFTAGGKFLAVRPGSETEKPVVAWESPKLRTSYCSPLVYRGRVYTLSGDGMVNCADAANGKALWSQRPETPNGEKYWASPFAAEGRLYIVSQKGTTTVLKLGKTPEVLAVNELHDTILASPVASGGALFLRSDKYLYCLAEKK